MTAGTPSDKFQPDAMPGYRLPTYPFREPPELRSGARPLHPVVVVGAGVTGLTLALDLGLRGVPTVLLDEDDTVGAAGLSSRGICYAKRTLEILDRLGVAGRMMEKGVTWNTGRVYLTRDEVYNFDLLPEADQKFPAFINLQQFYVEQFLVERIAEVEAVDLRWRHRVIGLGGEAGSVAVEVETPAGRYEVRGAWLVACDGGHSMLRRLIGAPDERGTRFEDRWCIADIRMAAGGPAERRFWLESDFADGGAAILHRMADDVWRTDFQIGHYPDPEAEATPARTRERLRRLFGPDQPFDFVWVGPWRFKSRLLARFIHGRVIFAGDSAHELPPFGARGGNGGIQDADNLGWKLALVAQGRAAPDLLQSYEAERRFAARENIRIASRSVLFVGPETRGQRLFRDAVLALARRHVFARPMVNTGRLSTPTAYSESPLDLPDDGHFAGGPAPGTAAPDGPLAATASGAPCFFQDVPRGGFLACFFVEDQAQADRLAAQPARDGELLRRVVLVRPGLAAAGLAALVDGTGAVFARFAAAGGALYVLRPDGHVLARSRRLDPAFAEAAVARCLAWRPEPAMAE